LKLFGILVNASLKVHPSEWQHFHTFFSQV
jgi:hypothetical protein